MLSDYVYFDDIELHSANPENLIDHRYRQFPVVL